MPGELETGKIEQKLFAFSCATVAAAGFVQGSLQVQVFNLQNCKKNSMFSFVFVCLLICLTFCWFQPIKEAYRLTGVQPPNMSKRLFFSCGFRVFSCAAVFACFAPGCYKFRWPTCKHVRNQNVFSMFFPSASVFAGFVQGGLPVQVSNLQERIKNKLEVFKCFSASFHLLQFL
jgi:hypothetical protein